MLWPSIGNAFCRGGIIAFQSFFISVRVTARLAVIAALHALLAVLVFTTNAVALVEFWVGFRAYIVPAT